MRTLVVSDLHLGAASGVDLLRRPPLRAALIGALEGVDRLVILGDGLELREVPVREAAEHAAPLLQEAGAALGAGGEIVMLAGNHDYGLVAGWIETRLHQVEPPALGLAEPVDPAEAGPLAQTLAAYARPARLSMSYPGIWLRDDVYAIHGHYADLHTTVPTIERLVVGAMEKWVSPLPEGTASPDDYEACLAPVYAWIHALAQRQRPGPVHAGHGASARAWTALARGRGRLSPRALAMRFAFRGAVGAINRIGPGPVRGDLSGEALRRGYLQAMGEVVRRLDVRAEHVLWGHSHRPGPLPADDASEWRAPTGAWLHNTGSWVYQRHFVQGPPAASPYWPGNAILVEDEGPPQLRRLLADRDHAALAPPAPAS